MSTNLMSTFDYRILNSNILMSLLKNMTNRDISYDKKKNLLLVLINKYFLENKSFNIYSFLNKNYLWLNLSDRVTISCNLLVKELIQTSEIGLNNEYKEEFFQYLLSFLKFVDTLPEKTNNNIEFNFDFNAMPKLIDYLNDANKLGITSASLRANLNDLVMKIKKNLEEKRNNITDLEVVQMSNSLSIVSNNPEENIKKLDDVKELKLLKSNLTQSKLEGIVSDFKLYSDKDKCYIIEIIKKKSWEYLYFKISYIDSFDFLVNHPEYQKYHKDFNLVTIFSMGFKNSSVYLNLWEKYFNVDNLISVFDKFKSVYMNVVEDINFDFESYFSGIVKKALKSVKYFDVSDTSELIEYRRNELQKEFDLDFEKLDFCVDFTLLNWLKTTINYEEKSVSLLEYYFCIIDKYSSLFFSYYPYTLNGYDIKFASCVKDNQKSKILHFVDLAGKITFTGDMLNNIVKNYDIKRLNNELVNLEYILSRFVRIYFCYHYNNPVGFLDIDIVRNIVYNSENLKSFNKIVDKMSYQGAFNDMRSYAICFFEILLNDLDFSNADDFKIIYTLGLNWNTSNKTILKKVIEKLKKDNITCYSLLFDYTEGQILEKSEGVFEFLKVYFEIE